MSGVTKLDRIRNERNGGIANVAEISKNVQESRLKLYGHVLRREEYYVGKGVMVIEVSWKRMRGSPKRKWLDNMMWDEPKYIVLYVYVGATETRRQNTAAQAPVRHGRSASDLDEFGHSYRGDQFWTQMARKVEAIDVGG